MAAYLGLPYGGKLGTEQLWIADAALCPELPIGWVEHVDESRAEPTPYYQSVRRSGSAAGGETMWEHPQVSYLRGVAAVVVAAAATAKAATAARDAARDAARASLTL